MFVALPGLFSNFIPFSSISAALAPSKSLLTVPGRYFHCDTFCYLFNSVSLSNVEYIFS